MLNEYEQDPYFDYNEYPDCDISDDNWATGTLNVEDDCFYENY
jgi:hypothetical protein